MDIKNLLNMTCRLSDSPAASEKYAAHLSELLDYVVPERIGDEYAAAIKDGDAKRAVALLADYYRKKKSFEIAELSAVGSYDLEEGEKNLKGEMRVVNVDWTFPDCKIDFLFDPTEKKPPINYEWLWQFNRHKHWSNFARCYTATGDERYAECFSEQLLGWVEQTYIPEVWNGPGSAWRTIECGIRLLGHWQVAFDGFRKSRSVCDEALLIMIASMHRQATHLVTNPTKGNWLMMEMNGVFCFSALFAELSDSEKNKKFASDRILAEIEKQILPDGFQNELSPDYHSVVCSCAYNFYNLADSLGLRNELPENFFKLMEIAAEAMIGVSTPRFTQPRTNDTFTIPTKSFAMRAKKILGSREEYDFVLSERRTGNPPKGKTASRFYPYSGFIVMRSDWGEDGSYLCFDAGPLGAAHIHQDKLNINVYKGSDELIYDDGGGQYDLSEARKYATSGYAHNCLLVDGLAQYRSEPKISNGPVEAVWITEDGYDYAEASYDGGFGKDEAPLATHNRAIRFEKPDLFYVKDTVSSCDGKNHDYEILFHIDTESLEVHENGSVIGRPGEKYAVAIFTLDGSEIRTYHGETEPYQGWFNGRNEENLHKASCLSLGVKNKTDYCFETLIVPFPKNEEPPKLEVIGDEIRVSVGRAVYSIDRSNLKG